MKLPINIVMLTPGFACDEDDTTVIPAIQLYFKSLHSNYNDLKLHILTFQYPFKSGKYSWNGIPVYSAGGKNRFSRRLVTWFRILRQLIILHRKPGIDVIHSFWLTEATLIGKIFSRLFRVPLVSTAMGQDVLSSNRYLWFLKLTELNVIILSQFQHKFLRSPGKIKLLNVIPFGIDPIFFEKMTNDRKTDIVGVGSLNEVKNYAGFITVISMISKTFPGLKCKIIGEGIMKESLEKLILENHLQNNIVLTGNLTYGKTISEMQSARILLHTSQFEGQALVITEALAAGLYVVSYPVGISATLDSTKLRIGQTPEELASHVTDILQNPDPDYSPEVHFTIEDTCRSNYLVYRSMIKS